LKIKSPIPTPEEFSPLNPPYTYNVELLGIAFKTYPDKDPATASYPIVAPNSVDTLVN